MAIAIPDEVRAMLEAPNYVHLATLRADGSPRSWVVSAGLEGDLADPISIKYTNAPFPRRGPGRVCFVIAVERAAQRTLGFVHDPA
ncbi:MAG: pyridoxamine 5'-phosphate oxidase family protein [Solirubrobacteraceae bacterium]